MSRSTKKPYYKDRNPGTKTDANRKVRKSKELPSGKTYKKVYCSYNISDYSFHAPKDKKAHRK